MSSDRVNRYKAQQAKIQLLREHREEITQYRIPTTPAVDSTVVSVVPENDVLDQFRRSQQQELAYFNEPIHIDINEVDALLSEIGTKWGKQQTSELIGNCRRSVISSIANPFGLGTFVAAWDKEGGNVTTQHNAEQGLFARDEEKYIRSEYVGSYSTARDKYKDQSICENSSMIQDEYSGDFLDCSKVQCDHIKPVKTYHKEGGWRQSEQTRNKFGSDPSNFAMTSSSGNMSMQDNDKHEWQQKTATDKSNQTNKEKFGHDNRRVNPALARGEKTAKKYADSTMEKIKYDGERVVITGVQEAGKMGLQQSIGLLLTEFLSASFDEISDSYRNGFYQSSESKIFLAEVKIRLSRIVERVSARWKDAIIAFKDGAISGFLSNLATMLINMLETTSKRIVRLIREGFLSILKAMKIMLFPPAGMTNSEAGDAALKLLATGVTVSLGILIEEVAEKSVKAFLVAYMQPLEQLTSTITAVLVGAFIGIATALVVATLDQLDLFGVTRQRKHEAILSELDHRIEESDRHIESMYQNEMGRMDAILSKLQGV